MIDNYLQVGNQLDKSSKPDSAALLLSNDLIVDPAWPANRLYKLLSAADSLNTILLLQNMAFRVNAALQRHITVVSAQMERNTYPDFATLLPAFSIEHPPRSGKTFHADLFAMAYPGNTLNWPITATVNHRPIPVEQGIAHYKTTFKSAGEHKIAVAFFITDALTGEVQHYQKELIVPVYPQ